MSVRHMLSSPRGLFEQVCRGGAQYAYLGGGEGLCKVLDSLLMYVDTQDTSLVPHLILRGCWEPWVTLALRRVPEHAVCVDVGANHGYFTLVLASMCARVDAYEPQLSLAAKLRRSATVNGLKNVKVRGAAIGASEGMVTLFEVPGDARNLGGRSIVGSGKGSVVSGHSLDALYAEERVDFIKIDAEGAEFDIWKGMRGLVARHKPTILMEFTPCAYDDARGFLEEIKQHYALQTVTPTGTLAPIAAETVLGSEDFVMLWLEA